MNEYLRVGAVQLCSTPNIDKNMDTLRRLTRRAVEQHAEFVAWPENAVFLAPERGENFQIAKQNKAKFLDFCFVSTSLAWKL